MIDIIVCFCDKDYTLIDNFIKSINLSMDYNLIFVDDRFDKSIDLKPLLKDFNYIIPPIKLGTFEARRLGFNKSNGEYVWFVDIDDELLDFEFIENNADINIFNFNVNDKIWSSYNEVWSSYNDCIFNDLSFIERDKYFDFGLWNKIFKRVTLDKVYDRIPFIDNLCFLDDTYLNKCFMFFARKIVVNEAIIYNYKCKNINGYKYIDHIESVYYLLDNSTDFMKKYFIKHFSKDIKL